MTACCICAGSGICSCGGACCGIIGACCIISGGIPPGGIPPGGIPPGGGIIIILASRLFYEFVLKHGFVRTKESTRELSPQEPGPVTGCWFSKRNVGVLGKLCFFLLDVSFSVP
jgi:hypothetical protein